MASTAIVSMDALVDYSSATSITSRPLYFPQCGQTRCGNLGSWQLGQFAITVRRRESCVRRAEVRRLECRRLGFGIFSYLLERCPPVVTRRNLAAALFLVAILPAHRTDPFAILATQLPHGERQQHELPQYVVQFQAVAFVEAHLRLTGIQGLLFQANGARRVRCFRTTPAPRCIVYSNAVRVSI